MALLNSNVKPCPDCTNEKGKNSSEKSRPSLICKTCFGKGFVNTTDNQNKGLFDIETVKSIKAKEYKEIRIQAQSTSDSAMLSSANDSFKVTPNLMDFHTHHYDDTDNNISPKLVENVSYDELKELAEQSFRKEQWEAAETLYRKMLEDDEEQIKIIGPKIFECILNAHPKLSDYNKKKLNDIIDQQEANGNIDIVNELKKQLEERTGLEKKDKKGWKFWEK